MKKDIKTQKIVQAAEEEEEEPEKEGLFGLKLVPGEMTTVIADEKPIRVNGVMIDFESKAGSESLFAIEKDEVEIPICILRRGSIDNWAMDVIILPGQIVKLKAKGAAPIFVHCSFEPNYYDMMGGDDYFGDEDDEEEEEEEEEEEPAPPRRLLTQIKRK